MSVMGIVLQWGDIGSVKRKTDNVELSRRDITIMDQGYDSVYPQR